MQPLIAVTYLFTPIFFAGKARGQVLQIYCTIYARGVRCSVPALIHLNHLRRRAHMRSTLPSKTRLNLIATPPPLRHWQLPHCKNARVGGHYYELSGNYIRLQDVLLPSHGFTLLWAAVAGLVYLILYVTA